MVEARFPEICETQPELLAHHYTEAGVLAQAIPYWQRAGQRAVERSANLEAVAHLTTGLELLATLPDTPERAQQELDLQTILGPALINTKGQAAPEVLHAYARARQLCQQVGETPQLFQVLRGLWYFYLHRLELQTARELGEQLLTLAQHVGDPVLRLEAHYALGNTLNYLGEFAAAQAHFAQGITLYDPQQHRTHAFRYGQDPGVVCRAYAGVTLWYLGYPDQALQRSHEALTLARELAHPVSLGVALFFATWVHHFRREWHLTQELTEAVIALGTELGSAVFSAAGTICRGWALAQRYAESGAGQEQREEGMAQMQQGLAAWCATGAAVFQPYGLALLAEASAQVGQVEAGLTLLAEALTVTNDTGERRWDAELHRLQGELLLARAAEQRHRGGNLLSSGPGRGPPPAGEILGAAGRYEPALACGSARASAPRPTRCWRPSTAGSPRASTLPTSRRPGRCSRRCREAIGVGSALARNSTSVLRGGQGSLFWPRQTRNATRGVWSDY